MVLVVATVVLAVAAGLLTGGRIANLAHLSFRGVPLVAAGLAVQVLLGWLSTWRDGVAGLPLLVVSQVALLAFLWLNRRLPGMLVALAGFALNTLVIVVNGAMPVAETALRAVSGGQAVVVTPGKHRLLQPGDPLPFLADVIPIVPLRTVVSVGDIVLALGVAILVVTVMRSRSPVSAAS